MELGILSLSDLQTSLDTGQKVTAGQRIADTIDYAVLGEQLGLDVFALGEHHSLDFAVSSPAVVLDAHRILGLDRFFGQFDWGGLPRTLVEDSLHRYATEIAPAVRAELGRADPKG